MKRTMSRIISKMSLINGGFHKTITRDIIDEK